MSVTHRSLSIAPESSFGSLAAATGLPSTSGLTFVSIPCERDPIVIYGEPVASERNDARDGSYGLPHIIILDFLILTIEFCGIWN